MKFSIGALFLLIAGVVHGQNSPGAFAINAGAGFSAMGILGSINISIPDEVDIVSDASTAYAGGLDFGFDNKLSFGIGGGYQTISQLYRDYQYVDADGNEKIGEFSFSMSRLNLGARILFHFGSGNIDAYAGIKPGVNIFNISTTSEMPYPDWFKIKGNMFAFQVIPLGVRAYFTNNIGVFFETGIGAPTFISGGLCLGFGESRKTNEGRLYNIDIKQ